MTNNNSCSKSDKLGFVICILLLASFTISVFYWALCTEEISRLLSLNIFYSIFIILGILSLYDIYFDIVMLIFFPETNLQRTINQKQKEYRKMYPIKVARLKTKQLEKTLKIKDMNNELKNIKDKIMQEESK
jgi:hypothetical protein